MRGSLGLGLDIRLTGDGSGSNPLLSLISKYGVPGLIFDNSPPTVFTDALGTLPAGIGDVVGNESDLSGGGHDLTQGTTAAKPTLRAGPLLEYDGVDDFIQNTSQPFTGDELTIIWCGRKRTLATGFIAAGATINDGTSTNEIEMFFSSANVFGVEIKGTVGDGSRTVTTTDQTVENVYSTRVDTSILEVSEAQNRQTGGLVTALDLSAATTIQQGRVGFGFFSNIDSSYLFMINKYITSDELSQAEQYIASACGVSL